MKKLTIDEKLDEQYIKFTVSKADEYGYNLWLGTFNHTWFEGLEELEDFFANLARTKGQIRSFNYIITTLRDGGEEVENYIEQGEE